MNLYFLVEGNTEAKLYPAWLGYLVPKLLRINDPAQAQENNYYLFNAGGYPDVIGRDLTNAIYEVNESGKYSYLVVCFDADEESVSTRKANVYQTLQVQLNAPTELVLIVQNRCLETWFLGHRKFYKRTPQLLELQNYTQFYDVSVNDPELMDTYKGFVTVQQFHKEYYKRLCQEREVKYSEAHVSHVLEESYLKELQIRIEKTSHLQTFREFHEFCLKLI